MSYVVFDQEKEFMCPCGCGKKLTLSIQQTEGYGWNAYVMDGQKIIAAIGENNLGD